MDTIVRVPPSQPGYDFTIADLQRASVTPEQASRIILQRTQGGAVAADGTALLAAILKACFKQNCYAQQVAYSLPAWSIVQLQGLDYARNYFELQNVGSGDLMVIFEPGPNVVKDLSSPAGQTELTLKQTYAFRIVAGGNYAPFVAPVNPITIFTLGTATNGTFGVGRPV